MADPPASSECPSDAEVVAWMEARLEGAAAARLRGHLTGCESCRFLLEQLAGESPRDTQAITVPVDQQLAARLLEDGAASEMNEGSRSATLARGTAVGRYLILTLLGRGSMGEVYSAYDPELHRKVALKLLRTARASESGRLRLLREARSLGRLSHPNVVQIHDAGEHAGDVFLAMELVEGRTLADYCATTPRPAWRQVWSAYLDAARGLAAAHAKGLVHRDIKPANILLGNDGRVRVADFGLAAGQEDEASSPPTGTSASGGATALADTVPPSLSSGEVVEGRLTVEGTLLGTPLYMAPEQHGGPRVTAASDQYSLCGALYEGLYGVPPFAPPSAGSGAETLLARKLRGPPAPPPRSEVPAWLHRALARGLSPSPHDRYPDLPALIAALSDDPTARRRARVRVALVGVGALGVAVASIAVWANTGTRRNPCASPEQELAGVWDDGVEARVRQALLGTGRPYAADTSDRTAARLTAYAAGWTAMRGEVCEGRRRAPQRQEVLALRDACLDRRLGQLRAVTGLLAERPDPAILDKAVATVAGLVPIAECADVEALRARVQPPEGPKLRAQVAALQPRIDRLEVLYTAGKYREVETAGEPLEVEAGAVPYPELGAQAAWWVGLARDRTDDHEGAKAMFRVAAGRAAASRDPVLVAEAWSHVLLTTGAIQKHFEEAAGLRQLGPTLLAAADDNRARREWFTADGNLLLEEGTYPEAKAELEEALAAAEKAGGAEDPLLASSLNDFGRVLQRMGDFAGAIAIHRRALALRQRVLGPNHPNVAQSLTNLGAALSDSGDVVGGLEANRQALKILEAAQGPESRGVAIILSNVGDGLTKVGQWEAAATTLERSLVIWQKVLGPEHPDLGIALGNLGLVRLDLGETAAAAALFERARAIQEKALGSEHPDLAFALAGLGRAQVRLGALASAAMLLERAHGLRHKLGMKDDEVENQAQLGLGELALARHQPAVARGYLESLLMAGQPSVRRESQIALADALWSTPADRPRARSLVADAQAYYQGLPHPPGLQTTTRWLAEHPSGR